MSDHLPITDDERPRLLARIVGKCVEEGGCLIWHGCFSDSGVPQVSFRGRACSVRRVLHECITGQAAPAGMVVAPRCRHPRCVSPDCAMLVSVGRLRRLDAQRGVFSSPQANAARRVAARKRAAIPDAVVEQVRAHVGTCAQAAEATGVSLSHCKAIRAGRARRPMQGDVWKGLGA